jgi:hypothetical protein
MVKVFDVPKIFLGGGRSPKLICSTNNFFWTGRAQSEKVGQFSFRPPNFFLPVRPWLSIQDGLTFRGERVIVPAIKHSPGHEEQATLITHWNRIMPKKSKRMPFLAGGVG